MHREGNRMWRGNVTHPGNTASTRRRQNSNPSLYNFKSYAFFSLVLIWYMSAQSLPSYPTLYNPMDCSLQSSSVHGILQARTLEWVALPSPKGSSQPRGWTHISCISCIASRFFTHWATWGADPFGRQPQIKMLTFKIFFRWTWMWVGRTGVWPPK